jgi:hypothetical protein
LESTSATSQVLSNTKTSASTKRISQLHASGPKRSMKFILIQMGMNCRFTDYLKKKILQVCYCLASLYVLMTSLFW